MTSLDDRFRPVKHASSRQPTGGFLESWPASSRCGSRILWADAAISRPRTRVGRPGTPGWRPAWAARPRVRRSALSTPSIRAHARRVRVRVCDPSMLTSTATSSSRTRKSSAIRTVGNSASRPLPPCRGSGLRPWCLAEAAEERTLVPPSVTFKDDVTYYIDALAVPAQEMHLHAALAAVPDRPVSKRGPHRNRLRAHG